MTLALISALPEEQQGLAARLVNAQEHHHAGRIFLSGSLASRPVVLALSGIGKVAAATTATCLIERFGARQLLFTGVAGGLGAGVQVGDLVVAQRFIQHDMNAEPLFARWQVPGYADTYFNCDAALSQALLQAAEQCAAQARHWNLELLGEHQPRCHSGLIVSGDQFIVSREHSQTLHLELSQAGYSPLAVEMEGAAIAQTCADYQVPFAAVRSISDRADDQAHLDFPAFVEHIASRYALTILERAIPLLPVA